MFKQIVANVIAIHHSKIYHRDLKPGNILVLDQNYVIADFGES
jgi:serine/threonine protein kinase